VLREDNRAIFRAASAASKAADWLLARDAAHGTTADAGAREQAAEPLEVPPTRRVVEGAVTR